MTQLLRALLPLLLLLALPAAAYDSVVILTGAPTPASNEFVQALRHDLANQNVRIALQGSNDTPPAGSTPLIIAVGTQALQQALDAGSRMPVLGVLIPQPAFEQLRAGRSGQLSAILLDQPWPRQLRLLQKLLPRAGSIGLLLGPTSAKLEPTLSKFVRDAGLNPVSVTMGARENLNTALAQVLENSDALLAVPDPLVHSRDTAQTVLLTSYRYQKPVIAYSQAYVSAGALAAVYSSPADVARQAADIVRNSTTLPPPQAPRYFSVGINHQVARSLGIETPDPETLKQFLIKEEP